MARNEVGKLVAVVTAQTRPFEKAINNAKASTQEFGTFLSKVTKKVGGLSAAVIGFSGVAVGATIRSLAETNDAIAKTADKLGLATEALVGMQFAAEQTGVSADTLNMAVQRMTRRIAEAAQGSGEAKAALRELGLDAQVLNRMSPDEAFAAIADAMGDVASQGDRVRLAMRLFDSEGVSLVNTLALGSAGLEDMKREMIETGRAMDRTDIAKIEEANDALNLMRSSAIGAFNQIIVAISPLITSIGETLADAIKRATQWVTKYWKEITQAATITASFWVTIKAATAAMAAWGLITKIIRSMRLLALAISGVSLAKSILIKRSVVAQAVMGPKGWIGIAVGIGVASAALATMNGILGRATDLASGLGDEFDHIAEGKSFTQLIRDSDRVRERLHHVGTEMDLVRDKIQRGGDGWDLSDLENQYRQLRTTWKSTMAEADALRRAIEDMGEVRGGSVKDLGRRLEDVANAAALARGKLADMERATPGTHTEEEMVRARDAAMLLTDQADRLGEAFNRAVAASNFDYANDQLKRLTETLEKDIDKLSEMTAEEKLLQLETQGASAEMVEFARSLIETKKALEGQKKIKELIEGMRETAATVGLSAEELLDYQLKVHGASEAQKELAKSLHKSIEAQKKLNEEQRRLESLAESIKRAVMTPLEAFEEQMKDLRELLSRGLIDEETFKRAVAQAEEELDRLQALDKEAEQADPGQFRQIDDIARLNTQAVQQTETHEERMAAALAEVAERTRKLLQRLDEPMNVDVNL